MKPERDFGVWLRQLRTARDLTQEALAELIGCATQTVRSFESGRRRPSRDMVARIVDTLEVPLAERDAFLRLARAPLTTPTVGAETNAVAPPPLSPPAPQHAWPTLPSDALIGRASDLRRVQHALIDELQRLVTLLGPGGIGKTRLALQAAVDLAPHFAHGAVVVALASVADSANVVAAIAEALGCPLAGVHDPTVALLAFLHDRTLLLVLDNLEHLLAEPHAEHLSDVLAAILRTAPDVRLLVTSRERLRLQAEWVIELGGLGLPESDQPNRIAHAESVLLFVERARRITGNFALTPANQVAVAQICRRLDGLPLALELAAAQVSFLPPAVLLTRLDQALPLLEGGARDLPARQRTMRAAISWSHNLLQPQERLVFQRLGVLVGSFSLAAAEAVGAGGAIMPTQVLGLLRRLVDQSLVVRESVADSEVRYRLLEPMRQFALEQLSADSAHVVAARERQVGFFLSLIEQVAPQMRAPQPKAAFTRLLARLVQEYPNVQAIINWSLARNDWATVVRMGWALFTFWWYRGQQRETRSWMEQVLAHSDDLSLEQHAQAMIAYAMTLYGGNAQRYFQVNQDALALCTQLKDTYGQAQALLGMSLARFQESDLDQAALLLQQAQGLSRRVGDTWLTTQIVCTLGLIWAYKGEYNQASAYLNDALATARSTDDAWNESLAMFDTAVFKQIQGDAEGAAQWFHSWLIHEPEIVVVNGSAISHALEGIAIAALAHGETLRAARMFGAAEALHDVSDKLVVVLDRALYTQAVATLRRQLEPSALASVWAEGRAMSAPQAVAYALGTGA